MSAPATQSVVAAILSARSERARIIPSYARRRRTTKRSMPAAKNTTPAASKVGSAVAVFGAMAPFENEVVVRVDGLGSAAGMAAGLTMAVSASLATGFAPAAESTHAFMSVTVMR